MKTINQYPGLVGELLRRSEDRAKRAFRRRGWKHTVADLGCALVYGILFVAVVTLMFMALQFAWGIVR